MLRAAALLIATRLLIWIGGLLISSMYNIAQDAHAVQEEHVVVTETDVADIDTETADANSHSRFERLGETPHTGSQSGKDRVLKY